MSDTPMWIAEVVGAVLTLAYRVSIGAAAIKVLFFL